MQCVRKLSKLVTDTWHKPYAAYLFDLDGTLIDTAPDLSAALNHCMAVAGFSPVSEQLTRHWIGHGARVLLEQAFLHHTKKSTNNDQKIDDLLPVFIDYYAQHLALLSKPYDTVVDTLMELRQRGAKLAVVTNKITRLSQPLLEQMGMSSLFDLIVCGDTTDHPKPAPDSILYCLRELAVDKQDCLFVGDSNTDVLAARAAGICVVCVRDGYNHGEDVTNLQVSGVIDVFEELL